MSKLNITTILFNPFWRNVKYNIFEYLPGDYICNLSNICYWLNKENIYIIKYIILDNCLETWQVSYSVDMWTTDIGIRHKYTYRFPKKFKKILMSYKNEKILILLKQKLINLLQFAKEYNQQHININIYINSMMTINKKEYDLDNIYECLNYIEQNLICKE